MHASQSEIFLDGEGDAWYVRNLMESADSIKNWQNNDNLLKMIDKLPFKKNSKTKVLEIGCGQGNRLEFLKHKYGWNVVGLDPSQKAIDSLGKRDIEGFLGTADRLPFEDNNIDLIIYGFCLCWVERSALFNIVSEANRVMKDQAWIGIQDFWHPNEIVNDYHHKQGLKTYKTRPHEMFSWHPSYVVTDHRLSNTEHSSDFEHPENWTASTLIRKDINFCETVSYSQF